MASDILIKIPAVSFGQVKGVDMSSGQEVALVTVSSSPSTPPGLEVAVQRAAQLEHNIRFLREQHQLMLSSLHKEVEALRQRNRELQFQLVMSSANSTSPPLTSLLQDDDSPENDFQPPRVMLSPRQPNLSPLQVEILEKDLAELRIDLKEERDKNQQLHEIVKQQRRHIDELNTTSSPGSNNLRDAQCQAGAAGCVEIGKRLDDAQRTIRTLRRENEGYRKELSSIKANLSKIQQHRGSMPDDVKNADTDATEVPSVEVECRPSTSQQDRFPPIHSASGYWQHNRHGMELSGAGQHSRSGRKDSSSGVGSRTGGRSTALPALHTSKLYVFQGGQRQAGSGGHRHGYFRRTPAPVPLLDETFDGIQGRKYRGGRGQRERQLQQQ